MGEQFICKVTERAKRRREEAFERELTDKGLFSAAPETFLTVYRCRCTEDAAVLEMGDPLLVTADDAGKLLVLRHNVQIGYMLPRDAAKLRHALAAESRSPDMCYATVSEPLAADRTFTIVINPVGGVLA